MHQPSRHGTYPGLTGLWLLILLSSAKLFGQPTYGKRVAPRPNIIVFMVDDMGWQDTSVPFWTSQTPLNQRYHTPNMARLASHGVKFTSAYATPVCTPTRVSLLRGMNEAHHKVTNGTDIQQITRQTPLTARSTP